MDERHWWLANKIQETFRINNNERQLLHFLVQVRTTVNVTLEKFYLKTSLKGLVLFKKKFLNDCLNIFIKHKKNIINFM